MIEIECGFILSTGRKLYAHGNVFETDRDVEFTEGQDGGVDFDTPLTKIECIEIANYMINLWTQWRDSK